MLARVKMLRLNKYLEQKSKTWALLDWKLIDVPGTGLCCERKKKTKKENIIIWPCRKVKPVWSQKDRIKQTDQINQWNFFPPSFHELLSLGQVSRFSCQDIFLFFSLNGGGAHAEEGFKHCVRFCVCFFKIKGRKKKILQQCRATCSIWMVKRHSEVLTHHSSQQNHDGPVGVEVFHRSRWAHVC